ncbi:hypothetical protein [Flavobacterium ardleyense]|uniref:hypothetical protein n=1 Tax=Flavobacterium ardleyense TaxID=2038737 RepID=UPI0036D35E4A
MKTSLWLNVDPLAEKFSHVGCYVYVFNNPINLIDPDGRDIIGVFDKKRGTLSIVDLDHYKKSLPSKVVSPKDYVYGGIRDKKGNLTHNQTLEYENVFSGGESDKNGNLARGSQNDPGQSLLRVAITI